MAITIIQSPETYAPAYNPIWWVVSSTNTAQSNFEFICDIYITGVTFAGGASYLRLKTPVDPVYNRGVFNIAPILQRQLTGDLGDTTYGFQQCSNSVLDYSVKFGELYGASSGVIAYPNLTNSTGKTAFNASLQATEWRDYTTNDYAANTSATQIQILSNMPSSGTIVSGYSQWIYALSQTSGAIKFANINSYNSSGTLTNTARVINTYHDPATTANRMIRFPAGYNVSLIPAGSIVSGTLSGWLNTTNNYKWEIYFMDSSYNRISESFYSSWNIDCTDFATYQVYFKNKWGGYDTFDFTRANQKSVEVKRSKYEKPLGEFKSASSYTYADKDRFDTNFNTNYKEKIKLTSNWITEAQSTWLQELITSPDIRVDFDTSTHYLIPVNITETTYTQRQHRTDKIFNIEITIEYSFNEVRQGA